MAFANFMGIGPIAYFLFGRKHAQRRIAQTEGKGNEETVLKVYPIG